MPIAASIVAAVIEAGRFLDRHGWVPATAGNISHRLPDGTVAITRSGVHKGRLTPSDIIAVTAAGTPLDPAQRPSAETLLHCQIYAAIPATRAILHGHSVAGTVLSMTMPGAALHFAQYEVLKAFEGQTTHDTTLALPMLDNDQDMPRLAAALAPVLPGAAMGYLIRGHGTTMWADDMDTAMARLEAIEFLLACELTKRTIR